MLKTYVGHYTEGVEVVINGQSYGVVKPGESIVVPDDIAAAAVWPDVWEDAKPPAKSKGSE